MRIAIVLTSPCLKSLAVPLGRSNNFSSVRKHILPQKNQTAKTTTTTNEEQLISDKQLNKLTCQPIQQCKAMRQYTVQFVK